eukprot:TRINITY_DN414_c0_g1_i1.p2 TRINITY_DN414_c0_g1~~TRINITY_DN414_c0_g1_i1.p2  ORF type:complete len:118 (-),score=14.73 TRINITY_DN414_c0_g1_i1:511-864(-)
MKGFCLLVLLFAFAAGSQADSACDPINPCQAGLFRDKQDAVCTVTPEAPGGYTCQCGRYQRATFGPNPSTCVECSSASPCALVHDCPEGLSCVSVCGDQRGTHCETPGSLERSENEI